MVLLGCHVLNTSTHMTLSDGLAAQKEAKCGPKTNTAGYLTVECISGMSPLEGRIWSATQRQEDSTTHGFWEFLCDGVSLEETVL